MSAAVVPLVSAGQSKTVVGSAYREVQGFAGGPPVPARTRKGAGGLIVRAVEQRGAGGDGQRCGGRAGGARRNGQQIAAAELQVAARSDLRVDARERRRWSERCSPRLQTPIRSCRCAVPATLTLAVVTLPAAFA